MPWLDDLVRPKKSARLPTALNQGEVARLLEAVRPEHVLMVWLLYGTGMRLMECLRLRVKDLDFVQREILIRDGKGAKDRVTVLPQSLVEPMQQQLRRAAMLFGHDRAAGHPGVYLPHVLNRGGRGVVSPLDRVNLRPAVPECTLGLYNEGIEFLLSRYHD